MMKKLGYKITLLLVVSSSISFGAQAQGASKRPPFIEAQEVCQDVAGVFVKS